MEFLAVLLLLLLATRLAGEAFRRIGQAPLIGEVLTGIALGPAVLAWVSPDPVTQLGAALGIVVTLGILFLVLSAGLEVGAEGLRQALRDRTYIVAATEFVFPFGLGYALAEGLGMNFVGSMFLGTAMAVTALPVSVRILMDLNLLGTRFGRGIVSVAAANDVTAFALLGIVLALHATAGAAFPAAELATSVVKVLAFIGMIYAIGWLLRRAPRGDGTRRYLASFVARLRTQEAGFAIVLVIALAMAVASEQLGLHFAIGVFYAGVFLTREVIGEGPFVLVQNSVRSVSLGFLAPFFFAFVGLNVALQVSNWYLVLAVTAVAFAGKVFGGLIGGSLAGFRGHTLAALAVGLNARGMMELLLAQVGLATGIINADLYSALVIMTIVTTLSTPPIMKAILKGQKLE